MKFAFSTLGCPYWSWDEIVVAATDLGYDGIELRGLGKELYAPRMSIFWPEKKQQTMERLQRLNLQISCLTSACYLFEKEQQQQHRQTGCEYIDLAAAIGSPYIRVMGDLNPQPVWDIDDDFVADNLRYLAAYAEGKNVTVLLESNGAYADSARLAALMQSINSPAAGVLWDVHHPYRYNHETPPQTYGNLRPWLRYLHMKDSVELNGKTVYKMMGEGDVPNSEVLELLRQDNFAGFVSLEWVKRWNQNLSEPGIVFPRFINYVKRYSTK